jgi:DNA repair protein RadC
MSPFLALREVEEVWALGCNAQNQLIDKIRTSIGEVDGAEVNIKSVIRNMLRMAATSFVLVHNHPSGKPDISGADVVITMKMVKAARTVDLEFMDHIIVAKGGLTSLRRQRHDLWAK